MSVEKNRFPATVPPGTERTVAGARAPRTGTHGACAAPASDTASAALPADFLNALLDHTDCSLLLIDDDLRVQSAHGPLFTGLVAEVTAAADLQAIISPLADAGLLEDLHALFAGRKVAPRKFITDNARWLRRALTLSTAQPPLALVSYRDETSENYQQLLLDGEKLVVQSLAQRLSLQSTLDTLLNFIECHSRPGVTASVLLVSEDGRYLRPGAGRNLPPAYLDAVARVPIGPRAGSCGTAAYRRARVIVADIATDPLWEGFRGVALQNGLRACWSDPILSATGKVLGTFAMYCDRPVAPSKFDLILIDTVTRAATFAIEHARREDRVRLQSLLLANVQDALVGCDSAGAITFWSKGAAILFGYSAEEASRLQLQAVCDFDALRARVAEQGGAWRGEVAVARRDGVAIHTAVNVSTLLDADMQDCGYVTAFPVAASAPSLNAMEQSRRQRAIAELGNLALGEDSLQSLMDATVRLLAETLDVPLCKVLELSPDGASLRLRAGVGWAAGLVGSACVSAGLESQAGYTLSCKTPVRVEDLRSERRFSGPPLLFDHGVVSGVSVIIMGPHNAPFGVLGAHSQVTRVFTDQDADFVQSAANILAAAIRRCSAEESLRDSEQQFRHLANAISQIVWSADGTGQPDYFNERWYTLSGVPAEASKDVAWRSVLHPEDAPVWYNAWHECVAAGTAFELEYRFYDATAVEYRWHLGRAVPVWDQHGKVCRWYGSSTDIDDQKRTQLQLLAQTHTLEMVNWVNSILASQLDLEILAQTVVDMGTKLIGAGFGAFFYGGEDLDPGCFRLYVGSGLNRDILAKPPVLRLTDVFGADLHGNATIRSADISIDFRYGNKTPFDGLLPTDTPVRSYCAATIVSRSGEILGGLLFGHLQAEMFDAGDEELIKGLATQAALAVDNARMYRALWESEDQARRQLEQINAIYATAPVGLCFLDAHLRFKSMNEHLAQMAGTAMRDVEGKTLQQVLGEAAVAIQPLCEETLSGRLPILDREVCWRTTGGNEARHWLCSCYPIRGAADDVLGVNTVVQDITARKQNELELLRLAEMVAGAYDAIIAETLDGTVSSWNRGAERLYGYRADEIVGLPIDVILPERGNDTSARFLLALQNGERMRVEEAERICKDGRHIYVSMTISPLRNASGEMIGVSTIERDITLRKETEQAIRDSEARMRFILSASRVGTWEWSIESGAVHWSENMEPLHGRAAGSFDGTFENVLADIHPQDRDRIRNAAAQAMESTGDYHVEYRVDTADGATRWVESKGRVVRDAAGAPILMAGICMDITERKQAEDALRVSESMLRNKADELAVAHRQKDDFLAMLAHELRNPLAPISNSVQLLKMHTGAGQPDYVPWAVDVIDRQVGQISRLVDDLLDVARITRGRIELQKEYVNAADIMRQAVETVMPAMTTKQHVFEVRYPGEPLMIHADPVRLVQSLANLLNNAAKFTPEGGRVVFSASHDSELVLRVIDNGVGISPDIVPQVFDLFVQEDRSLDRRQGGLGLGLSLVKRLIEMHGGHVAVVSAGMGRGSEFIVRLPLVDTPASIERTTRSSPQPPASGAKRALRILVVDDNAESAEAMAILLRAIGHEVNTAYNGHAALEVTRDAHPDVVFLDIGLPIMDGYEVARQLRALYDRRIVLIALTGYAQNADDERQRQVAFDHYVLKPVAFDHLQALLAQHQPQ